MSQRSQVDAPEANKIVFTQLFKLFLVCVKYVIAMLLHPVSNNDFARLKQVIGKKVSEDSEKGALP
jgi:hypothetical protein